MSDAFNVTADELRQMLERIEQFEAEKRDIAQQLQELYAEAKGRGFDTKGCASSCHFARKMRTSGRRKTQSLRST